MRYPPFKRDSISKLPQHIIFHELLHPLRQYFLGNTTTVPSVDFFDNAFTFSNNVSKVTCCHPDNTPKVATCGQGVSCEGQCSALGASLCPSGECTDCDLEFNEENTERQQRGRSTATLSGTDLAWCTSDGCRVRKHKGCCYNPKCLTWKGRKETCQWLNYLTGIE